MAKTPREDTLCVNKIRFELDRRGLVIKSLPKSNGWLVDWRKDGEIPIPRYFTSLAAVQQFFVLRPEKTFRRECYHLEVVDSQAGSRDRCYFNSFSEALEEKGFFDRFYQHRLVTRISRVTALGVFAVDEENKAWLRPIS